MTEFLINSRGEEISITIFFIVSFCSSSAVTQTSSEDPTPSDSPSEEIKTVVLIDEEDDYNYKCHYLAEDDGKTPIKKHGRTTKHGQCLTYYGDILVEEEWYDKGYPHGIHKRWTKDDKNILIFDCPKFQSDRHGMCREWYDDGTPKYQGLYNRGEREGLHKEWYPEYAGLYLNGRVVYRQYQSQTMGIILCRYRQTFRLLLLNIQPICHVISHPFR